MEFATLVLTIVCILCLDGAWATSEPVCMSNVTLGKQATAVIAPATNPLQILGVKSLKKTNDNDGKLFAMSAVSSPFKNMGSKLKMGLNRFQRNLAILCEWYRRRNRNVTVGRYPVLRRIRYPKPPPMLPLPRNARPRSVRWIPEATLRAYIAANFTSQALRHNPEIDLSASEAYYSAEFNGTIVAMH